MPAFRRAIVVAALSGLVVAILAPVRADPAGAVACAAVLDTPGSSDCTFAPGVSTVTVDVYGAEGADGQPGAGGTGDGGSAGLGQRVTATIAVAAGETLRCSVGAQAVDEAGGVSATGDADGGDGGLNSAFAADTAGGGGAASDVRRGGFGLADLAVAAGGGGGGGGGAGAGVTGGDAGGGGSVGGNGGASFVDPGDDGGDDGAPGGAGGTGTVDLGGGGGGGSGASATQVGNGGGGGSELGTGGAGGTGGTDGSDASDASPAFGIGVGGNAGILGTGGAGLDSSAVGVGVGGGGGGGVRGGGSGGNGGFGAPQGGGGGGGGGAGFTEPSATDVLASAGVRSGDGQVVLTTITSTAPSTTLEVGDSFTYSVAVQGFTDAGVPDPGAPTFSVSPALPDGLDLDPTSGEISGTVTASGTTSVTVTASATLGDGRVRETAQVLDFAIGAEPAPTTTTVAGPGTTTTTTGLAAGELPETGGSGGMLALFAVGCLSLGLLLAARRARPSASH